MGEVLLTSLGITTYVTPSRHDFQNKCNGSII
jgi:hypothetical protein